MQSEKLNDYWTFIVHHYFQVSPSARCVSAGDVICSNVDIFNIDFILFADIDHALFIRSLALDSFTFYSVYFTL
jgi:hypothetical protein